MVRGGSNPRALPRRGCVYGCMRLSSSRTREGLCAEGGCRMSFQKTPGGTRGTERRRPRQSLSIDLGLRHSDLHIAASDRTQPHPVPASKITKSARFPRSRGHVVGALMSGAWAVGRVGLEPTTGGL